MLLWLKIKEFPRFFHHTRQKEHLPIVISTFPSGFPKPLKNCPEVAFLYLLAVTSDCPVAFKSIFQRPSAKTEQFLSIFLRAAFTILNIKRKFSKFSSSYSPNTGPSDTITLFFHQKHPPWTLIHILNFVQICVQIRGVFFKLKFVSLLHHVAKSVRFIMQQVVKSRCCHMQRGVKSCRCIMKQGVFATVPESSINSWVSWFIFNLRKINTCY